jgi:hypothetical protein
MATVPVLDPIESRSNGQDAVTLQFERLERVRVRLAARRRHRWIVATKLVIALVSISVLIFAAIRRTSVERLDSPHPPASVGTETPQAASPTAADVAVGPPSAADVAVVSPSAVVPPRARGDSVKRDATHARRLQANPDRRRRPLSGRQDARAAAPSRGEAQDVEAAVPTAAIDWLLKSSRTSIGGTSEALLPDREEIRRR